jgi:hypothetical protein
LIKGRLILLTDNLCFSSCLSVTDDFRALGALHIGQTTDAATYFVDVRESNTCPPATRCSPPCNRSIQPAGPFEPALTYGEDFADTTALETWVKTTAVHFAPSSAQQTCI